MGALSGDNGGLSIVISSHHFDRIVSPQSFYQVITMGEAKGKQVPSYGNPQLNIRLEKNILDLVKAAAEEEGMSAQEWTRRAILLALGQDVPGSVGRAEFDNAIAKLSDELETVKGEWTEVKGEWVEVKKALSDSTPKASSSVRSKTSARTSSSDGEEIKKGRGS
jgi:hypothetical protein